MPNEADIDQGNNVVATIKLKSITAKTFYK